MEMKTGVRVALVVSIALLMSLPVMPGRSVHPTSNPAPTTFSPSVLPPPMPHLKWINESGILSSFPSPRSFYGFACDTTDRFRGTCLLTSGARSDGLVLLSDTWIWNGSAWLNLTASGSSTANPYGKSWVNDLAWDPTHHKFVEFGALLPGFHFTNTYATFNITGDSAPFSGSLSTVGGNWSANLSVGSALGTSTLWGNGLAWDKTDGYVISFGGCLKPGGSAPSRVINYTYKFDGSVWTNISSTAGATWAPVEDMGWTNSTKGVYFFGGYDDITIPNFESNAVYLFSNGTWSHVTTTGTPPTPRDSMAFAPITNRWLVLFGGYNSSSSNGGAYDDTWIFDTATSSWTNRTATVPVHPSGRWGELAAMPAFGAPKHRSGTWNSTPYSGAYGQAPSAHLLWLFGGFGHNDPITLGSSFNDFWALTIDLPTQQPAPHVISSVTCGPGLVVNTTCTTPTYNVPAGSSLLFTVTTGSASNGRPLAPPRYGNTTINTTAGETVDNTTGRVSGGWYCGLPRYSYGTQAWFIQDAIPMVGETATFSSVINPTGSAGYVHYVASVSVVTRSHLSSYGPCSHFYSLDGVGSVFDSPTNLSKNTTTLTITNPGGYAWAHPNNSSLYPDGLSFFAGIAVPLADEMDCRHPIIWPPAHPVLEGACGAVAGVSEFMVAYTNSTNSLFFSDLKGNESLFGLMLILTPFVNAPVIAPTNIVYHNLTGNVTFNLSITNPAGITLTNDTLFLKLTACGPTWGTISSIGVTALYFDPGIHVTDPNESICAAVQAWNGTVGSALSNKVVFSAGLNGTIAGPCIGIGCPTPPPPPGSQWDGLWIIAIICSSVFAGGNLLLKGQRKRAPRKYG